MGFIVFLVFAWVIISLIRQQARAQREKQVLLPPDFFGLQALPPEHVRQVGGVPAAVLPVGGEESSSELMRDELAGDHDLDLSAAEVVSLDERTLALSVTPRALPVRDVSLETEVDWNAEHDRFHKRYVDARPAAQAAARGLLDDLRDPAGARRAVLLAEILGPPVSLRR